MPADDSSNEVQVGAQGRLVIPATLRKALNIEPGDRLVARKVGAGLVLEPREAIEQQLWELFASIPQEERLADELIEERRQAARDENDA